MIYAKIIPKTQQAKNRVAQHGPLFLFGREEIRKGLPAVLVYCHQPDCEWSGWFTSAEAKWELAGGAG